LVYGRGGERGQKAGVLLLFGSSEDKKKARSVKGKQYGHKRWGKQRDEWHKGEKEGSTKERKKKGSGEKRRNKSGLIYSARGTLLGPG